MPANYVLLEKITVGAAGASSVTFSSIPQTGYTDLVVKASTRTNTGVNDNRMDVSFNGSSSSFSSRFLFGSGSSVTGATDTTLILQANGGGSTANTFSSAEIYIPNYTSASNKSYSNDGVTENNATSVITGLLAGLWSNTAAITSITLTAPASLFVANSTFYLYGVAKLGTTPAIVPYATGGDTIMTDGTYWYHAFLSSGTFTPQKGLSCDVLAIAGGGGGGAQAGGGGGAGGLVYLASQSLSITNYTVTIGGGGAGSSGSGKGSNGSNSQLGSLTTASGGGGGGTRPDNPAGSNGGSGGGGSYESGAGGTGSQGSAGGTGSAASGWGGGGGGATAVGGNAGASNIPGTTPGNGGAGSNTYSSWATATSTGVSGYYAGGGGGGNDNSPQFGTGGAGGGGRGATGNGTAAVAGTANTGSGGGGGGFGTTITGGTGGSGIVIVRYAV